MILKQAHIHRSLDSTMHIQNMLKNKQFYMDLTWRDFIE